MDIPALPFRTPQFALSMWCRHCQQDVPASQFSVSGEARCARCQHPLTWPAGHEFAAASEAGISLEQATPPQRSPVEELLDVETDRRLQKWRRMLRSDASGVAKPIVRRRVDPPLGTHKRLPSRRVAPSAAGQVMAWMLATLGTIGMLFGVGTLAWSLAAAEPKLWNWGLGLTLAGQSVMVAALIQLLASLWNQSRHATGRLAAVQSELDELQRTSELLLATRTGGAASFYADVARQANPQLLLVNLKGQLDELAARLK